MLEDMSILKAEVRLEEERIQGERRQKRQKREDRNSAGKSSSSCMIIVTPAGIISRISDQSYYRKK